MENKKQRMNPFDRLLNFCLIIVNMLLAFLIVLVVVDVIMTKFFDQPLKWSLEISEYALAFITFLGAGWLMREEGHIRFDMVLDKLPVKLRVVIEAFVSIMGVLVSSVVVWAGVTSAMKLYERGARMESILQLPRWVLLIVVPIGFAILCIQLVRRTSHHIRLFISLSNPSKTIERRGN